MTEAKCRDSLTQDNFYKLQTARQQDGIQKDPFDHFPRIFFFALHLDSLAGTEPCADSTVIQHHKHVPRPQHPHSPLPTATSNWSNKAVKTSNPIPLCARPSFLVPVGSSRGGRNHTHTFAIFFSSDKILHPAHTITRANDNNQRALNEYAAMCLAQYPRPCVCFFLCWREFWISLLLPTRCTASRVVNYNVFSLL